MNTFRINEKLRVSLGDDASMSLAHTFGGMFDKLLDAIEPHVVAREVDDFLRADAVVMGLVDGVPTYVVVEVSCTGDVEDIVRAERRAKTLHKAGLAAIPLMACEAISPESLAWARMTGVRVWCNGSMIEAAA